MDNIEKNDVDLSKLFAYKSKLLVTIPGTDKEVTLYQRIIGDEFVNRARIYALRRSGELRENLRNPFWTDRIAYIPNLDKRKKDEIMDLILALSITDITQKTLNKVQIPIPKEPGNDATLKEQEDYQKKIDAYPELYTNEVQKKVEAELASRRKVLNKYVKADLKEFYEDAMINQYTSELFVKSYKEMTTFFGTFVDEDYTVPAYKTFEDFQNTPQALKEALMENYERMETESSELKKLRGATQ